LIVYGPQLYRTFCVFPIVVALGAHAPVDADPADQRSGRWSLRLRRHRVDLRGVAKALFIVFLLLFLLSLIFGVVRGV
jgi:hypothetical protein